MRNRFNGIFTVPAVLLGVLLAAAPLLHGETLVVKVGIFDHDPLCDTENLEKDGGIFLELLKHVAGKERWELSYVPGTQSEGLERLKKGSIDLMVAVAVTDPGSEEYDFSEETVISTWAQVYAMDRSAVRSLRDLKSKTVGLVRDDPYNRIMRETIKGFNIQCIYVEFKHSAGVFAALKDHLIDAGVVDRLYGVLHGAEAGVKQTPVIFSPVELRFATAKNRGKRFIDAIDYHMELMKNTPDSLYYRLLNQVLGEGNHSGLSKPMIWGVSILLGLMVTFGGTSLILRKQVEVKTKELSQKNRDLMQEIAERMRVETAMRESEEKFRLISEQALMSIAILQDNRFKYANDAFARLTEYSIEEIVAWEPLQYAQSLHSDDRAFVLEQSRRKQQGESDVVPHYSYRFFTRSGKLKWVENYSRSILFQGRHAVLMTLVDVTEAKESGEKLAQEKERLAVTLRSIGEGVIAANERGEIILMNRVAEKMTGWKQEEAVGQPVAQVFSLQDEITMEPMENPVQRILLNDAGLDRDDEGVLTARDGTSHVILQNCAPIRDRESRLIGAVLVFYDITEKRKMEMEMHKSSKLESLGVLAGGIAHDFNNLLAVVIGNTGLAKMSVPPGDRLYKLLDRAEKGAYSAVGLSKQLLTFSRGGMPEKETASIRQIIEDSVTFALRGSATACKTHFPDELYTVEVDRAQMSQVFQNLVINAHQAMPTGGVIDIKVENLDNVSQHLPPGLAISREKGVKITIKDQGVGIPQDHLEKVFDPFFTTKQEGNGLGLSLVYSIVRKHDGYIDLESEVGEGTTFNIYLPASNDDEIRTEQKEAAVFRGKGSVLVMDDNDGIREMLSQIVEQLGYEVDTAPGGEEALILYEEAVNNGKPFDVVIMDLTISGGMGGKEAIGKLLEMDPGVTAVVASGYSTDPVVSQYKKYGFKGVINKPFRIQSLSRILSEVISDE